MALTRAQEDFLAKIGAAASADMRQSGVLASLKTAQAILESGWGTSALATQANNLFGVKAGSNWAGPTHERSGAKWRAYGSWEESIADHSALLQAARYAAVIGETDYRRACQAIQDAGYAGDSKEYAGKLIGIIEGFGLARFDSVKKEGGGIMPTKTAQGLVAYAKAQLGKPYWYACFGNKPTAELLQYKAFTQYPYPKYGSYTPARMPMFRGHIGKFDRVHDCIGLIKGYLWSDTPTSAPKYNAAQDKSANGTRAACKVKGLIGALPETPGALVFSDGHVGVYIGGGQVIEARGSDYGVVQTALKSRGWTSWGLCPWIEYGAVPQKPAVAIPAPPPTKSIDDVALEVIRGNWGAGDERKKKLAAAGYDYATVQRRVNETLKN